MNGMYKKTFPFVAIVGQEAIKEALLIAAVNTNINGLLIAGDKGTGKSTLVRSLANLLDHMPFVNLPLNITEDRLVGSLDLEGAIKSGSINLDSGLFYKADGGFLYVDEINLLPRHITNIILQVGSSKENNIQRDGINKSHRSDFILVGTMNPEEGKLRPQLLDRFSIFVEAKGETDQKIREEIIKRRLEYEKSPEEFINKYQAETIEIKNKILRAREIIGEVKITEDIFAYASKLGKASNAQGHRAEINLCNVGLALAALDDRREVLKEDIDKAAKYVLSHRLRDIKNESQEIEEKNKQEAEKNKNEETNENLDKLEDSQQREDLSPRQLIEEIAKEDFQEVEKLKKNLELQVNFKKSKNNLGPGKRLKAISDSKKGRYIRYRIPRDKNFDLALDATLRSAVFHENKAKNLAIEIRKSDLREKVREKRSGASIVFIVDASGSMGAKKRMGAAKGAVLALLTDAYEKRDKVGVISFRDEKAQVLLELTRSVDLAEKRLKDIKTGGKTPLAHGLKTALIVLKTDRIKNPGARQFIVLITDGKANVPLETADPLLDSYKQGQRICIDGIQSLVIDTEKGFMNFGLAKTLADQLNADYIKLDKLTSNSISQSVKEYIRQKA